jgi:hypothetical protein
MAEELGLEEVGGIALQFTGMNGRLARADVRWMAAATSSLPVPLSPSTRTGSP